MIVKIKKVETKEDEDARDEEILQKEFSLLMILLLVILAGAVIYAITAKPGIFHMTF